MNLDLQHISRRLPRVVCEPGSSPPSAASATLRQRAGRDDEVVHRRGPWRTFEAVEFATLEWVDSFNNRRLLESIGFIPPAEAEERYFAMLNDPAMAA